MSVNSVVLYSLCSLDSVMKLTLEFNFLPLQNPEITQIEQQT